MPLPAAWIFGQRGEREKRQRRGFYPSDDHEQTTPKTPIKGDGCHRNDPPSIIAGTTQNIKENRADNLPSQHRKDRWKKSREFKTPPKKWSRNEF